MEESSAKTNTESKVSDSDGATEADVPHHHIDGNGNKDIMGSSDAVAMAAVAFATSVQTASTTTDIPVFRRFTKQSYEAMLAKDAQEAADAEARRNTDQEEKLVDGRLTFSKDNENDDMLLPRDDLAEGCQLPRSLGDLPPAMVRVPLEEIDPGIDSKTFIVISYRFGKPTIMRFSAKPSFFIFTPWNPVRRAAIALHANQYLDLFVITCILVNCILLALPYYSWFTFSEYVFLAIYSSEAIIKLTARGFFVDNYTYLRDYWNWLDFGIVILSWITQLLTWINLPGAISNISGLRALRVLRALKTVSIVPGLKLIVNALLGSMPIILQLLVVILYAIVLFSLFAVQFYAGALRQKCLRNPHTTLTHYQYAMYSRDTSNWYDDGAAYKICGNLSGSGGCPVGYTCQPNMGDNAEAYVNFDNLGWATIAINQIITLDNTDDLYDKTLLATGPWNVIFFAVIIFIGAFYLINMLMAVVSLAYAEEGDREDVETKMVEEEKKKEEEAKLKSETSTALATMSKVILNVILLDVNLVTHEVTDHAPADNDGSQSAAGAAVTPRIPEDEAKEDADIQLPDRNCKCCARMSGTSGYATFRTVQDVIYIIVNDFGFEIFITVVIVLNVLCMAISFYGMPQEMSDALDKLNYTFLAIFMAEAAIKIFAMPTGYWKDAWNIFDQIVIAASLVDVGVSQIRGLSVIRTFRLLRLLRIFKLAKTWRTMRLLLKVIIKTLSSVINVTIVLVILLYVCAVMGYQLFAGTYNTRWNFNDFFHAFFLVFRIVSAADCVQPLYDCLPANGLNCLGIFLPTLYLGSFVVLNLFLALLLNAFDDDSIAKSQSSLNSSETGKSLQTGGLSKIRRLLNGRNILVRPEDTSTNPPLSIVGGDNNNTISPSAKLTGSRAEVGSQCDTASVDDSNPGDSASRRASLRRADTDVSRSKDTLADNQEDAESSSDIQNCFVPHCYKTCSVWERLDQTPTGVRWRATRAWIHKVTQHPVFEYTILAFIVASSVSLCLSDIYIIDRPVLANVLNILDYIYCAVFCLEMVLKIVSLGLRVYFTTVWNLLDFFVVMISIVSIAAASVPQASQISFLRALRTLRALRPLRAASKLQGLKIVIDSLARAIPAILNVLAVCMTFWLVFDIAAVQVFGGAFWSCQDADGNILDPSVVPNMTVCQSNESKALGYQWVNYNVNFDNVLIGFVALFQLGTLQGFVAIIEHAQDMTSPGQQPSYEASFQSTWFFIAFIIVGALFTLNLIVGVLIDNFNTLRKKTDGSYIDALLSDSQRKYYMMLKRMTTKKPDKSVRRPQNTVLALFYDVSTSFKFEMITVLLILFNLLALVVQHYRQPASWDDILDIIDAVFTTMFVLEAIVKMIGLRWHYFRQAWNVFDFTITLINVVGIILGEIAPAYSVQTTTLRAIRLVRIARLLRVLKLATGVRKILFSLVASLPAIFNIATLLFLIVFIYSVIGMNLFGYIAPQGVINDVVNFQTFASSLLLMFRLATGVSWDAVLEALMVQPPDCDPDYYTMPDGRLIASSGGSCGNSVLAVIFLVTYIAFMYLILTNMYIAVILENFEMATEQEEIGVTEDDFEMFYFLWEKYDPHATQFIKYEQLSDFVGELDEPLGIPKPNEIALVSFDLNVYDGDRLHCVDVLRALVKRVIGKVEDTEQFKDLLNKMEATYNIAFPPRIISSVRTTTIFRKKEDVAAKTLQRAWRRHKTERQMIQVARKAARTWSIGVDPQKLGANLNTVLERSDSVLSSSDGSAMTPMTLTPRPSIDIAPRGGEKDHHVANGNASSTINGHSSPTSAQNGHVTPTNGHVSNGHATKTGRSDNGHSIVTQNGTDTAGAKINGNAVTDVKLINDYNTAVHGGLALLSANDSRSVTPVVENAKVAQETVVKKPAIPLTRNDWAIKHARKVLQAPTLSTLIPALKQDTNNDDDGLLR